jgi:hypothetical protein
LRRIVHIFLLLCLPLYGFAMQSSLPPAGGAAALVHELEHDEGVYHHHEDDGSVHYDESDESLDHVQDSSSSPQPANFSLPHVTVPPEQLAGRPQVYIALAVPEPFLDGPHRPPASSLGHAAGGLLHT